METIKVKHPSGCGKIAATIYAHYSNEEEAKKIASQIDGGFCLKNNKTSKFTVFYPATMFNFANKY